MLEMLCKFGVDGAKILPEMRGCELEMWYGNRKDTVEKAEEEGAKIVPEKWGCEFE